MHTSLPSAATRQPTSLAARVLAAIAFPWQGAVLVLSLTAGAALHQHPAVLRSLVHTAELATLALR